MRGGTEREKGAYSSARAMAASASARREARRYSQHASSQYRRQMRDGDEMEREPYFLDLVLYGEELSQYASICD